MEWLVCLLQLLIVTTNQLIICQMSYDMAYNLYISNACNIVESSRAFLEFSLVTTVEAGVRLAA